MLTLQMFRDVNNGWITAIHRAGRKHKIAHAKKKKKKVPCAFKKTTINSFLYLSVFVICFSLKKLT